METIQPEPPELPPDVAAVLELSDERDVHLRLRREAFREGWQAAEVAHADDYNRGYHDGVLRRKHAEHEAVEALRLYLRRWELRGGRRTRATFAEAHPADFTGGPGAVERTRQEWLRAGFSLGPGPGWVHLGGRLVHHNGAYGTARCTAACYAYEPGWYRIADAIAIIETLPGDYAEALAELRAQQIAEAA